MTPHRRAWPHAPAILALLGSAVAMPGAAVAQEKHASRPWRIKGQLSEACSCAVPCACNFGERPSPYEYCHTMWSYWVQEGNWDHQVRLNDLRVGGVEGPGGIQGLLDARADATQRAAMENIWHLLSGRMLCLMRLWPLKASGAEPGERPAQQGSIIRTRFVERQFLGFEYVPIDHVITERGAKLTFPDGGFEAAYIFGRDAAKPVTVTNIVSWPIPVSIKGKTIYLRYKNKFNQLDYQGTNANQGHFDLSHTQPAARPMMAPK